MDNNQNMEQQQQTNNDMFSQQFSQSTNGGTKVDIIVDVEELNDTVILQIKEIATAQLGCTYENVTIIQSN